MIKELVDVFQYGFMQNALYAIIISSIICSIIGTYIVVRRLVFISDGIAHTIFAGVGISHYFGINITTGAFTSGVIAVLIFEILQKKLNERKDSIIGILLTAGMATGIIFIYITPGYTTDLFSYLFGNILMVSDKDIRMMYYFTIILVIWTVYYFQYIKSISFDEEFVKIIKLPVNYVNIIMLIFICFAIVILIKISGIILVIAMLIIPPSIANIFTFKFKNIMLLSVLISVIVSFAGLLLSFYHDLPSGATIVLTLSVIYLFVAVLNFFQMKIRRFKFS